MIKFGGKVYIYCIKHLKYKVDKSDANRKGKILFQL